MQTQTAHEPTRLRSAVALARAVIRDLAEQDSGSGDGATPAQQIKAWRRAYLFAPERARLARAAKKARGQ